MADKKITQLTADTTPSSDDLVETVNDPAGTPASRKVTLADLTKGLSNMVGDSGSGGTKGLVPAPAAGDAAAGKFLKADGTFAVPPGSGAETGANSDITSMDGLTGALETPTRVTVAEVAAPSTPPAGTVHIYAKSDGKLYIKDDTGAETDLTGGGGSIAPLVIEGANEVAQRNGASDQTLNIYDGYTDASNYSRIRIGSNGSQNEIMSEKAGSGTLLVLRVGQTNTFISFNNDDIRPNDDGATNLGDSGARWAIAYVMHVLASTSLQVDGAKITRLIGGGGNGCVVRLADNSDGPSTWSGNSSNPSIGTSQNNYTMAHYAHQQRWDISGTIDITGMVGPNGNANDQKHIIVNVGSGTATFKHQDANSTAANRFLSVTGADIPLAPNEMLFTIYDNSTQRWRIGKL